MSLWDGKDYPEHKNAKYHVSILGQHNGTEIETIEGAVDGGAYTYAYFGVGVSGKEIFLTRGEVHQIMSVMYQWLVDGEEVE